MRSVLGAGAFAGSAIAWPHQASAAPESGDPESEDDDSWKEARIPRDIQPAYPVRLEPDQVRPKLLELLGMTIPPVEVGVQEISTEKADDGITVTRLTYRNSLGETVPAVLMVPTHAARESVAGVVCLSGTSGTAERVADPRFHRPDAEKGPLIGWGRELARNGFAALAITLRGTVSRRISYEHWQRHVAYLAAYGRSFVGVMVDEALRACNILAGQDAVDPARIGLTGMSLGGQIAWYAMACQPSVRTAAAVAGSIGTMACVIHEGNAWRHGEHYFVPHMLRYFDYPRIVSTCVAPRPLMAVAPIEDADMPRAGVERFMDVVQPVYEAAGCPECLKVYQPGGGHVYRKQYFQWVLEWLRRQC